MNVFYQKFKEPAAPGSRDPIFKQVIYNWSHELEKPHILNIGSERDPDLNSRAGDGWANFYWAELIQQNGVRLVIVDVDSNAINVCQQILSDFVGKIDIEFVVDSGLNWIDKEPFNFAYFDGPDDNAFTLNCFEKVDRDICSVLCDDANYGGKADLLKMRHTDYWFLPCNHTHALIFYPSKELIRKKLNKV